MNLFYLRLFSAIALYMILPLSTKFSAMAGAVLFFGYRSFLILTPLLTRLVGKNDLQASFMAIISGVLFYILFQAELAAVFLISFGFSVSGFLIKNTASQTPKGSGINKIALSIGGIISGAILATYHNNLNYTLFTVIALILTSMMILAYSPSVNDKINRKTKQLSLHEIKKDYRPYITWLCFGTSIGMRFFGLYLILPHYLVNTIGHLPKWYGLAFTTYSFIALLAQFYAINNKNIVKIETALLVLSASIFIMISPNLFFVEYFLGAILWIALIALEELYSPYLDFHAVRSDAMLIKEIGVGMGGILCVVFVKYLDCLVLVPIFSTILLGLGYMQLRLNRK